MLVLALAATTGAYADQPSTDTLADLSLEELGNIEVTSVSKRAERLLDAPASIYVITHEDIRRSGVSSLPEALRLAPNLEVARVSANAYAISARGFNNATGNKLQVLLDGRILYTPLFSGVFWDMPDVVLEDVDRIEVISGPGGTLWGANAVNGVINVITRSAAQTQGALVSASAGDREGNYAIRYGGAVAGGAYRLYAKYLQRDATDRLAGGSQHDGWNRGEMGFRADWGEAGSGFTLQGAAYGAEIDSPREEDLETSGFNMLARWNRRLASGAGMQLQAYVDHQERDIPASIAEDLDIYDIEFQHDLAASEHNSFSWGISHRKARDDVTNAPLIGFLPPQRDLHWTSVFAQDELSFLEDRLTFVGGLRVEHNSYTGTEVLPTLRVAWKPTSSQLLWAAATRAVRTPSRLDRELYFPSQPPFVIAGGPDFDSEVANVFELGYRSQPTSRISYSITAFHHDYDKLRTIELQPNGSYAFRNGIEGRGNGLEAWGAAQITPHWRVSLGANWLDLDLHVKPGSTDAAGVRALGNDPKQQWLLRSSFDLPGRIEFDGTVRHVGRLPSPQVPAYTAVDLRLSWRLREQLELSLVGENVFDDRHVEFVTNGPVSEIERQFRVGLTWSF